MLVVTATEVQCQTCTHTRTGMSLFVRTSSDFLGNLSYVTGWEEDWLRASGDLADSLGIDPSTAAEVEHRRVFHLYLPIFFWLKGLLRPERNG